MKNHDKPGFLDIFLSVSAAFFGVQKNKTRIRDFEQGKPIHFILTGIILTFLFLTVVFFLVKLALKFLMP